MSYRSNILTHSRKPSSGTGDGRMIMALVFIAFGWLLLAARFFQLQVLEYRSYRVLASDQHEIQSVLIPKRGTVYLRDRLDKTLYPIAKDRDAWHVFATPRTLKTQDIADHVQVLPGLLSIPSEELEAKLSVSTSSYAVIAKDVPYSAVEALRQKKLAGIGIFKSSARLYPETGIGGQFLGFVVTNDQNERVGQYGVEGFEQKILAGEVGSIQAEKDAAGRRLTIGTISLKQAKDGSDIVLTIDRAIQYKTCRIIADAVKTYQAESGTIVVMDPKTGAVLAMCSSPDFDSATFNKERDMSVYNNPATFHQFEPGSSFKPITLAAGVDAGKIMPNSTYTDTGEEKIDDFTIRNADKLAHGVRTMSQVLEQSLNTGTIYVQRLLGRDAFREYVAQFGYGEKTGIELSAEARGNITPLTRKGQVYAATASFGQGITVTALQLAASYTALANGGTLMKPYLVQEIIRPDGQREIVEPQIVRRVITERSARLVTAMMVNVVEKGHGKKGGVPGYYVAGKTGTAQIANPNGKGYLEDGTIGSFAGYAPADNPKFVMVVKMDKPKIGAFAESTAAPVFGELAKYLLTYFEVPPERPITVKPEPPLPSPVSAGSTSSTRR